MPYCELPQHDAFLLLLYTEDSRSEWLSHDSTVFTLCNQTFFHPSLISLLSSQLACFAPGGMVLRENFSLHGFGRSEFSWDVQSLRVLSECFPRGSIGTDRTVRPLARTHDLLQGRSWDRTLVHTVIFGGVLVGAC